MKRLRMVFAVGLLVGNSSVVTRAQSRDSGLAPVGVSGLQIGHDELYGTSWGVASYGSVRNYSAFSSPYGAGYGYGYPSYGFVPNRYGMGLWRPGAVAPGYTYGMANAYRTFPYPYKPGGPMYGPPMGVYAPGFGPGRPVASRSD